MIVIRIFNSEWYEFVSATLRRDVKNWIDSYAPGSGRQCDRMVVILLLVPNVSSSSTVTQTASVPSFQTKYHLASSSAIPSRPPLPNNYRHCYYGPSPFAHQSFSSIPDANKSQQNYSREFVNHVTRINISNDDFSQIDGGAVGAPEAVVKEGESK